MNIKIGTQEAVYQAIKSGKRSAEDIAEAVGINKRQVYGCLRRLINKGLVERYEKVSKNTLFEYRQKSSKRCLLAEVWSRIF